MNAAELRKQRMDRIKGAQEVTASAQTVTAGDARSYDPLTMKPTKLDDVPRRHGYVGPQPDAGYSYGSFTCASCKATATLQDGLEMRCPDCGEKMAKTSEIKSTDVVTSCAAETTKTFECKGCKETIISADGDQPKVCPQCGEPLKGSEAAKEPETAKEPAVAPVVDPAAAEEGDQSMEQRMKKSEATKEEEGTSMVTETLANFDELSKAQIAEADVNMILYGEDTENPHWNIDVFGKPVCAIYLNDQEKPDVVRKHFISANYGSNVSRAISEYGLDEMLKTTKAHVYATSYDKSKVAQAIEANVRKEYKDAQVKAVASLREDFMRAAKVAVAGINKGIWPDTDNPLQMSLYDKMSERKVMNAESIIVAAFEDAGDDFFRTVTEKAEYLMNLTDEARAEAEKIVSGADVQMATASVQDEIPMVSRMSAGNFPISASSSEIHGAGGSTRKQSFRKKAHLGGVI